MFLLGFALVGCSGLPAFAAAPPFTFTKLTELVETGKLTSVEALIESLPTEYRTNAVFMLESASLQTARPDAPRAILFGHKYDGYNTGVPDGEDLAQNPDHLYIAFQTDPGEQTKKPQTVEVIEWIPEIESYAFHELEFAPPTEAPRAPRTDRDTTSCMQCHGNPLRPNWTSYSTWPGAYGDKSTARDYRAPEHLASLIPRWPRLQALQLEGEHGPGLSLGTPAAQLAEISNKIGAQLAVRALKVLEATPDYDRFRYAIAAGLKECDGFDAFFDPAVAARLREGVFRSLPNAPIVKGVEFADANAVTFAGLRAHTAALVQRAYHFSTYPHETSIATWMRFVLEGRGLGDTLRNMIGASPKELNDPAWSYDFVNVGERFTRVREALKIYRQSPLLMASCADLAARSRQALRGYAVPPAPAQALVRTYCAGCHSAGERPLPLNDLEALRHYRSGEGLSPWEAVEAHRMPKAGAAQPSEAERAALLEALAPGDR